MLPFALSFVAIVAALLIPAFIGLVLTSSATRFLKPKYVAAFAIGIFFWYFSDTINDSAQIDVSAGFTGGAEQIGFYALFAIGLILIFSLDGTFSSGEAEASRRSLAIPILVAVAIGIHGFGEGAAFGATASSTSSVSLLDAFGGVTSALAFMLHKALEPMIIGACYFVYSWNHTEGLAGRLKDIALLTAIFSVPAIVGAAAGYYVGFDSSYAFALGTGTSIYAAVKLARPLYTGGDNAGSDSIKIAILIVLGFTCLYLAALLHQ